MQPDIPGSSSDQVLHISKSKSKRQVCSHCICTVIRFASLQNSESDNFAEAGLLACNHSAILVSVQDTMLRTLGDREAKKKMSPTNAKALNTMRQRLKKHNVQYTEDIAKYKANPESTEEEESADSDDSEDSGEDTEVEAGWSSFVLTLLCGWLHLVWVLRPEWKRAWI